MTEKKRRSFTKLTLQVFNVRGRALNTVLVLKDIKVFWGEPLSVNRNSICRKTATPQGDFYTAVYSISVPGVVLPPQLYLKSTGNKRAKHNFYLYFNS